MYDLGETYPATALVKDADGNPVDPATITFTFTLPDGTTTSPTPTKTATGRYEHDFPLTQHGLHRFRAVSVSPPTAYADAFNVVDASWPAFIGLDEVKDHLNIPRTNTTHDEELRGFILSASEVVESIVGRVARSTVTQTFAGDSQAALLLTHRPVLAIVSVEEDGVALTASDYTLGTGGVLTRKPSQLRWAGDVTVAYEVGRAAAPWSVVNGTKELLRINWRPQVGGNNPVFDRGRSDDFGQQQTGEMRLGFFIPNTVMERLQPHARGPHIA